MKVKCPTCTADVVWDSSSPFRPFCSKRCQMIDLGEWANEEKYVSAESTQGGSAGAHIDPEDVEAFLLKHYSDTHS